MIMIAVIAIVLAGGVFAAGKILGWFGKPADAAVLADVKGLVSIERGGVAVNAEKGMTLPEVIEAAKNDDSYDKYVDKHQVELALAEPCVLGSRLAVWMLKEADLKVYLFASDQTRAMRVFNREGGDLQQIKDFTAMRDREDTRRYQEFYGIDNNDYSFCDLIIDVNEKTPEEIVEVILKALEDRKLIER